MANNVVVVNATSVTQSTAPFGADILAGGTLTVDQDTANPSQVKMLKNLYTAGILTLSSGTWLTDTQINSTIAGFTNGNNIGNLRLGGDVYWIANPGAPTDGTSGTGAGFAGIGSVYSDTTAGKLYVNGGTTASPAWKIVTSA